MTTHAAMQMKAESVAWDIIISTEYLDCIS